MKSSEDTLFYLYVILNMLKSADLQETILTPVICHEHVRCHDGVTLYVFLHEVSIGRPKEDEKWKFFWYISRFPRILSKNNPKKEERDWTLVNTENLRAEIATCQRQYYM